MGSRRIRVSFILAACLPTLLSAVPRDAGVDSAGLAAPFAKASTAAACTGGRAGAYACSAIDLLAHLDLGALAAGRGNDIWGWTDPRDGREYALVGVDNATVFVEVTNPSAPRIVGRLPTQTTPSGWRDIKVYRDHAFVVSEASGHGMQVFNLRRLVQDRGGPVQTYRAGALYSEFGSAHNLAINEETGFAYAVGTRTCSGGLHMVDIRTPGQPRFAGCFDTDGYTHDVQCVVYRGGDLEHRGREICVAANEDTVTVVDTTDKGAPRMLSRTPYAESGYTHQGWLSEDHSLFFANDEADEQRLGINTRTYVWDMADLDAPRVIRRHGHRTDAIDHNLYVLGDHVFMANYTAGLRVMRIMGARGRLAEAGFFDVFPGDDVSVGGFAAKHDDDGSHEGEKGGGDARFDGAWSVYPYFASRTVVVSSISGGLFVLRPTFAFGGGGNLGGVCNEPRGSGRFCTACGPCGEGEGDCDADAECAPGLSCVDDVGAQFGFAAGIDVCTAGGGGGGNTGCSLPAGHGRLCEVCGPCGAGEGDCDSDAECAPGLGCVDNVGADFGFAPGIDVCLPSGGGSCPVGLGTGRYCTLCGRCGAGEGDCDSDAECAPGLGCAQNVGAQFGFAPGVDVCVAP